MGVNLQILLQLKMLHFPPIYFFCKTENPKKMPLNPYNHWVL